MSVYPTNSISKRSTACGCQVRYMAFHPTPRFSVCMPHQILPGLCYCLTSCFSSFLKLLRPRSHVRIVLGRPNFISVHSFIGWSIGSIVIKHGSALVGLGWPWASVVNPGQLWTTGWRENLSGKPTYFDDGWFDPDDLVSVKPDSEPLLSEMDSGRSLALFPNTG